MDSNPFRVEITDLGSGSSISCLFQDFGTAREAILKALVEAHARSLTDDLTENQREELNADWNDVIDEAVDSEGHLSVVSPDGVKYSVHEDV